ncbi:hypothetical protein TorRG33x02_035630 [Trema orientale]|uniref:Uncharacterized protein n=1 Tax=Trema orientale TaxID=63057 RepID=A0A2P5FRV5_TREOI|nr:hypothetical protein TorRG33x02_035630 [Trema orientale]
MLEPPKEVIEIELFLHQEITSVLRRAGRVLCENRAFDKYPSSLPFSTRNGSGNLNEIREKV